LNKSIEWFTLNRIPSSPVMFASDSARKATAFFDWKAGVHTPQLAAEHYNSELAF
jgi:hypothetical protein